MRKTTVSSRIAIWLWYGLLLLCLFGLPASAVAQRELSVVMYGEIARYDWMMEEAAKFMEANPDIHIDIQYVSANEFGDYVSLRILGGDPPDLITSYGRYAQPWIEAKLYVDLLPLFAEDPEIDLADYAPSDSTYQGEMLAFFEAISAPALLYNIDVFLEAGLVDPYIQFTQGQWTWRSFEEAGRKLTVDLTGDDFTDQYAYRGLLNLDWNWQTWVRSNSGDVLTSDGNRSAMNSPATVETFEFLAKLHQDGLIGGNYNNHTAVMATGFLFHAFEALATSGVRTGFAPYPTADPSIPYSYVGNIPGSGMMIMQGANVDLAWAFLKHLLSFDAQLNLGRLTGREPTLISARAVFFDELSQLHREDFRNLQAYNELVLAPRFPIETTRWQELNRVIEDALADIFSGNVAVSTRLQSLTEAMNVILAE